MSILSTRLLTVSFWDLDTKAKSLEIIFKTDNLDKMIRHMYTAKFITVVCTSLMALTPLAHAQNETANRVPSSLVQITPQPLYYSPYAFVVDKKARTLTVWHQDGGILSAVASFPADMGRNMGDKKSTGDHKTPNGIYFLQQRLEGPSLDFNLYGKLAFTTDYPNFFDRIDKKTGSGIWLHAVPDSVALTRGSRGCVVVRNEVIGNLAQYVKLGKTPIIIQDEVELLDSTKAKEASQKLSNLVEQWRTAWETKSIDSYINFYGSGFSAMRMNRDQWKTYKTNLNSQYKTLQVRLSRPVIYAYKDRAVVRFLQSYTSDQHSDFGEKTLFLAREGSDFKIIGEEWQSDNSQLAQEEFNAQTTSVSMK